MFGSLGNFGQLGTAMVSAGGGSGQALPEWILATAAWNDSAPWNDNELWKDAP